MVSTIAVIGAGAKAAAIVARAAVMREVFGDNGAPKVAVFEKDGIGAAWSGSYDYTNGDLRLCTCGEKDVGFPYQEIEPAPGARSAISPILHARFSFSSFLVAEHLMAHWVERGRPHPSHKIWARYLEWVFDRADVNPVLANVTQVKHDGTVWQVDYVKRRKTFSLSADGVVLTGSGAPRTVAVSGTAPADRVLDAKTFWQRRARIGSLKKGAIAVVGDGGAAGTIIAWLAQALAGRDKVVIYSISPMGTLFPRGDGFSERRWYSDPSNWRDLTEDDKRKLIGRTDAGVISMHNKEVIDRSEQIEYVAGTAQSVSWDSAEQELHISARYGTKDGPRVSTIPADYIISAIGFDHWSNLELVDLPFVAQLCGPSANRAMQNECESTILPDLSLASATGAPIGLHVPALGALEHGPGMSNLGSLGLMAAAVLRNYRASPEV